MKKVVLVGIMLLMFAGAVSASSINGEYEGNPIVKLLNNGSEVLADDVPALIYNGRTMVPISLLRKFGATVTWDQDNYAVNVKLPVTENNTVSDIGINQLKSFVKAADAYNSLEQLGSSIVSAANGFEVVYNHYMLGTDPGTDINTAYNILDKNIKVFNLVLNNTINIQKDLTNVGIENSEMTSILNNYSKAIDYLKLSYAALNKISVSYSREQYNIYFQNASTALSYANDSSNDSQTKYNEFINKSK